MRSSTSGPNHPERHADEFTHPSDFVGVPKPNRRPACCFRRASMPAMATCRTKRSVEHYHGQNLLAQSLHEQAYDHNPGFLRFRREPAYLLGRTPSSRKQILMPARNSIATGRTHLGSGSAGAGGGVVIYGLEPSWPRKNSGVPWLGQMPAHWELHRMKRLLKEHVLKGPRRAAPGDQPNKGCVRKEHLRKPHFEWLSWPAMICATG